MGKKEFCGVRRASFGGNTERLVSIGKERKSMGWNERCM